MSEASQGTTIYLEDIEEFAKQQKKTLEKILPVLDGLQEEINSLNTTLEEKNKIVTQYKEEKENLKAFLNESPDGDPEGEVKNACTMLNIELIKTAIQVKRITDAIEERQNSMDSLKVSIHTLQESLNRLKDKASQHGVDVDKIF